eukprot:gene13337-9170_t
MNDAEPTQARSAEEYPCCSLFLSLPFRKGGGRGGRRAAALIRLAVWYFSDLQHIPAHQHNRMWLPMDALGPCDDLEVRGETGGRQRCTAGPRPTGAAVGPLRPQQTFGQRGGHRGMWLRPRQAETACGEGGEKHIAVGKRTVSDPNQLHAALSHAPMLRQTQRLRHLSLSLGPADVRQHPATKVWAAVHQTAQRLHIDNIYRVSVSGACQRQVCGWPSYRRRQAVLVRHTQTHTVQPSALDCRPRKAQACCRPSLPPTASRAATRESTKGWRSAAHLYAAERSTTGGTSAGESPGISSAGLPYARQSRAAPQRTSAVAAAATRRCHTIIRSPAARALLYSVGGTEPEPLVDSCRD